MTGHDIKDDELVCCVCLHRLSDHVDEGGVWRCHSLGYDTYQCECALRKDRVEGDIKEYDLASRCISVIESEREYKRARE